MPYVQRNAAGKIESVHRQPQPHATEFLAAGDPQLLAFFDGSGEAESFEGLDAQFVRVAEDLVEVLLAKNLIAITDLPPQAQAKYLNRRVYRDQQSGRTTTPFAATGFAEIIDDTAFGPL